MSNWVSDSEFSSRLGNKVLIAGLSEAGKTAVKRIFFLKKKANEVDQLGATINYERMGVELNNVPITIVDLGGQRVFIKRFLSNFSPFIFSSVKAFLFVIDVAEKSTRNNAVQYFSACVNKLEDHSPEAEYFIFLHKNDLVINLPNYESIHAQLKEQFQLESDKTIRFLRTTIYRPETVIDAFGRIFEIAIPQAAQSSYVDNQVIGEVEEYAETAMTIKGKQVSPKCPECGNELSLGHQENRCSFCGYIQTIESDKEAKSYQKVSSSTAHSPTSNPARDSDEGSELLENLTAMMQDAILQEETQIGSNSDEQEKFTESESTEDDKVLEDLHTLMQESIIKETAKPTVASQSTEQDQSNTPKSEPTLQETQPSIQSNLDGSKTLPKIEQLDTQAIFLQNFYGITKEQAEQLIDSSYDNLFENAAQAGMPVPVLFEVFFKYIPYLKAKNIDVSSLTDTRLNEVFLANLNGILHSDEIFECLVLCAKLPEKSLENIIKQYLIKKRKKKVTKPEKDKEDEREPLPKIEDLISLSDNIGFSIKKEGNNIRLTFFSGNHKIDSNLVPPNMKMSEVNYLLLYEIDFPKLDNKAEFIKDATKRVFVEIKQLAEEMQHDTNVEEVSLSPVATQEQAIETAFMPLLDDKQLFFCLKALDDKLVVIIFHKSRGLGNIELPITATQVDVTKTIISKLKVHITTPEEMTVVEQAVRQQYLNLKEKLSKNKINNK